jgi:hypothetical protein
VSFTHRPEFSAISAPACANVAPKLRTAPLAAPLSDDRPTEAMNRSTADGLPITARPSPSLINSISLPMNVLLGTWRPRARHGEQ